MKAIKVLIIDDSKVIRDILKHLLAVAEGVQVVGEAEDPYEARELIKKLSPDVLTLDIEMPKMDGISFLKNLMRLRPMPVVMLSTLTAKGADVTLQALEIGAVDYITKPSAQGILNKVDNFRDELVSKIKAAAKVNFDSLLQHSSLRQATGQPVAELPEGIDKRHLIAIGASTGGVEAIRELLNGLPELSPPIVITQHIPSGFSERFAARLNSQARVTVHEAKHGQKIIPGNVYISPGNLHLKVAVKNDSYFCQVEDSAPVNLHKPSVAVLFDSLLDSCAVSNLQAVLLTGMGGDGAEAMLRLKQAGVHTLIQNKKSSLIWGMPGRAYELSAHCQECDLNEMARTLLNNAVRLGRG
jgi:two-component system chemotaxis response regulator CheB